MLTPSFMRDWPPLRLSKALLVLDRGYTQGLFHKMLEQLYAHQPNENGVFADLKRQSCVTFETLPRRQAANARAIVTSSLGSGKLAGAAVIGAAATCQAVFRPNGTLVYPWTLLTQQT